MPSEIVPPARALIRPPAYNCLLSYTPPEPRPRTFDKIRTHIFVTLPPFSAISSTIFPSIPPQPHVASSSPGTGRFQLSNAALGDLNMKLYVSRACGLSIWLTLFYQSVKDSMPAEQIRNSSHFPEATSPITWGYFWGHHPPVLCIQCSSLWDVLLRGYGQFTRHDSTPCGTRPNVF